MTNRENFILEYLKKDKKWRTNTHLRALLEVNGFGKASSRNIREIIRSIRSKQTDSFIIAGHKGYKVSYDWVEIGKYGTKQVIRANAINDVVDYARRVEIYIYSNKKTPVTDTRV